MSLRQYTSKYLREFNKTNNLKREESVKLREIDDLLTWIDSGPKESKLEAKPYIKNEVTHIRLHILSSAMLIASCAKNNEEDNIISQNHPAQDIQLCGFLNNICNTAASALHLIEMGFDTQARILARTLDERIYQTIILFESSTDYMEWKEAETPEKSKQAHYNLFSKKGRILKKIKSIEEKYLGLEDYKNEFSIWRKESETFYSMAVHGSAAAVLVGSSSFSFMNETVKFPNTLGMATSSSIATLRYISRQLLYFNLLFPIILREVHNWTPNHHKENNRLFSAINGISITLAIK